MFDKALDKEEVEGEGDSEDEEDDDEDDEKVGIWNICYTIDLEYNTHSNYTWLKRG